MYADLRQVSDARFSPERATAQSEAGSVATGESDGASLRPPCHTRLQRARYLRELACTAARKGRQVSRGVFVEELGPVVADVVDGGGDGPGLQVAFGRLVEQRPQPVRVLVGGV